MKNNMVKIISQVLFLLGIALFFTQCENDLNGLDQQEIDNSVVSLRDQETATTPRGPGQGMSLDELCACLNDNYPAGELTDEEAPQVLFMREEEKLARDVYLTLYEKWNLPIFNFISRSEQRHMDLVGCLISKFRLADPVGDNGVGVFQDPRLQKLYTDLTAEGSTSLIAALTVGAKIEDLDIYDLAQALETASHEAVIAVFNELTKGSRNHLRAFTQNLGNWGLTYEPLYLSAEAIEAILAGQHETGAGICGTCPNANTPRHNPGTCDGTGPGAGVSQGPGRKGRN